MQVMNVASSLARLVRVVPGLQFSFVALAATLLTSTVEATPVAFTLTSTASTLDLTAKYTVTSNTASITIAEQSAGSKSVRYSSPTAGSIKTDLYPTGIDFPGGSIAHAANQTGNIRPGVGGTGSPAAGNYGVYIAYPLANPIVLPVIDFDCARIAARIEKPRIHQWSAD